MQICVYGIDTWDDGQSTHQSTENEKRQQREIVWWRLVPLYTNLCRSIYISYIYISILL
jgi:hypothetical protein